MGCKKWNCDRGKFYLMSANSFITGFAKIKLNRNSFLGRSKNCSRGGIGLKRALLIRLIDQPT